MTSPTDNYMDIVVHRLVKSTIDQQSPPYKMEEICNLCDAINSSLIIKEMYEQSVDIVNLCKALKSRPLALYPVIESVDETDIKLCFPSLSSIPESQQCISMDLLKPQDILLEKPDVVNVTMEACIYDTTGKIANMGSNSPIIINPEQFICKIPSFQWQKLIIAVREENAEKLQTGATSLKTSAIDKGQGQYCSEISSEHLVADKKARQLVSFERKFSAGNVLQVQLYSSKQFGILTPVVQLINFTPQLDVCLEHRSNPVACFSISKDVEPISKYSDEESYKSAWLSVLNLEACQHAVSKGRTVIIHNITMTWQDINNSYLATFSLPLDYCRRRQLNFSCYGYFCIRYKGLDIPLDPTLDVRTLSMVNNGVPVTWVGHGFLFRRLKQMDSITVQIKLAGSSIKFPLQLLTAAGKSLPCTVEWIPKCHPDMYIEEALSQLTESSQLARDIAKHRNPVPLDNGKVHLINTNITQLPKPDPSQEEALKMAVSKPFTVIRGSAGTGKSMLAAVLILSFVEKNRRTPRTDIKPQVMVCGPTEQSLDNVANYLIMCGKACPKIVRVYSEAVEQKEFPTYRNQSTESTMSTAVMVDIALHHRIRGSSSQFSDSIQEQDMLLQLYPDDIGQEQVDEYVATVMKAEVAELREADVIICTCITSARAKLCNNTNIYQVIIDDCGMCTEPESMTPIILNKNLQQVTLFGDSQGLKPTVRNKSARLLGLQTSLMEAYVDRTVDLQIQYRMHDGIAELPAEIFYNNLVSSGAVQQKDKPILTFWPNKPVIFCRVQGQEELIKDPDDMLNRTEANSTITAVCNLVCHYRVEESNIVVLSPYKAQCELISKGLVQQGLSGVGVTTVLQSQGKEYDYVMVSLVRSAPSSKIEKNPDTDWIRKNVGEVSDPNQINLMLTRARHGLVLIGNDELLQVCPLWKTIICKLQNQGQVMSCVNFLRLI